MLKIKNKIYPIGLSIGLAFGIPSLASAHTQVITNLTEFYDYYDSDFTPEQQEIINGIFTNIEPYFGSNGLNNAINDGFIPLTQEAIDHGIHWFNPNFIDLTNMVANPLLPPGLNFDYNGNLQGIYWTAELYDPIVPLFQQLEENFGIANLTTELLTPIYLEHKATTERSAPDIFDAFDDVIWHQHVNVIIENLGARDTQNNLDPQQVDFRQSLLDDKFIEEVLTSLLDPNSVLSPLESDPSLGYPDYNRGASAGFHMLHMWVGQGNHQGLFAGTNVDVAVSANAIPESETFEDGTDGHGHGMEGGHHSGGDPMTQSTPEPSSLISLFGLILLPLTNKVYKYLTR